MLHWFGKRLREMQEVKRDERGFTLIELLVVVIIIGILAAIAIPAFLAQRDRAERANLQSDLRNAGTSYSQCITTTDTFGSCDSTGELDTYGFNPSAGATFTFAQVGATNDVTITGTFSGNTGTYTSANGQVSLTP